ncbi:MAG TPA: DUF5050 domain-containing protein [Clostridia bacterium]|nr:DUF5050 domain-containing protein [Clostridia bacterium]
MLRKKLVSWMLLCAVLAFCCPFPVSAAVPTIKILLNGEPLTLKYPIVVDSGTVLAPMKSVCDSLDSYYSYNAEIKTIIAEKKKDSVKLVLGSNNGYLNGKAVKLAVKPKMMDSNVYAPLEFVCSSFGYKYEWNKETNVINISKSNTDEIRGNTFGNIANCGYSCINGDWIYLSLYSGVYKMKKDGSEREQLIDSPVSYLNIVGDWIYYSYSDDDEKPGIYKMKPDGSSRKVLTKDETSYINIVDDWMYYINVSDKSAPYKVRLDGKGNKRIKDISLGELAIDDGWIYYEKLKDTAIYKMRTSGSDVKKITDNAQKTYSYINKAGDWIYYIGNKNGKEGIYKVKADGTGKVMLIQGDISCINYSDGFLYYADKDGGIYKIDEQKHQYSKLDSAISEVKIEINIANNWLYYYTNSDDDDNDGTDYRVRDDGSVKQVFKDDGSVKQLYSKEADNSNVISRSITLSDAPNSTDKTLKEVVKMKKAVVKIGVYDENGDEVASGSGFNIKSEGVIITNFHVIKGAYSLKCTFEDDKTYDIDYILNYNEIKDIAILQLKNANNLPVVNLGDSDKTELADGVVAIGNPYDFQNTVSTGIISGMRNIFGIKYLQTNAAISPGSSGGPLFDMKGNVIGMTSMYISGSQNLNLAVPINSVKSLFSSCRVISPSDVNVYDTKILEFEDNGSMSSANEIMLDREIYGAIDGKKDEDYYKLTLDSKQNILLFGALESSDKKTDGTKDFIIILCDENGREITKSSMVTEQKINLQKISQQLDKGTYYIKVEKAAAKDSDYSEYSILAVTE